MNEEYWGKSSACSHFFPACWSYELTTLPVPRADVLTVRFHRGSYVRQLQHSLFIFWCAPPPIDQITRCRPTPDDGPAPAATENAGRPALQLPVERRLRLQVVHPARLPYVTVPFPSLYLRSRSRRFVQRRPSPPSQRPSQAPKLTPHARWGATATKRRRATTSMVIAGPNRSSSTCPRPVDGSHARARPLARCSSSMTS
jgi:hypothetical protein